MDADLRERLIAALRETFNNESGPIDHALAVLGHAEQMLAAGEPGDEVTVLTAAILHDIGAAAATRAHGTGSHQLQESEGPPRAREIMQAAGMNAAVVDHVCRIIGTHHTGALDTPEFHIVWDADWLVNLAWAARNTPADTLRQRIATTFRTPTGRAIAEQLYLKPSRTG